MGLSEYIQHYVPLDVYLNIRAKGGMLCHYITVSKVIRSLGAVLQNLKK